MWSNTVLVLTDIFSIKTKNMDKREKITKIVKTHDPVDVN